MKTVTSLLYFSSVGTLDTGMPICTLRLVEHFARRPGYRVSVILPEEGAFAARARSAGATVVIVPFPRLRSPAHPSAFLRFKFRYIPSLIRIAQAIRRIAPDIIHFSDFIDFPWFPAAAFGRARVVAHLRLNIESAAARRFYAGWSRPWVDRTVCISRSVLSHSGITAPSRTTVIYDPGPDPALFNPDAFPAPPDTGTVTVLAIAKFLRIKGHDLLVDAAHKVEQASPGRVRFVVIGDRYPGHDGFYRSVIRRIDNAGLSDRFTILGQLPHAGIPAQIARADLFAHLPRYQEGLGGVVLEAMAMGKPVVAFDSGGVGECITDGESGFLVPQYDTDMVARRIVQLAADAALRRRMGEKARDEVRVRFSMGKHFEGVGAEYERPGGNE